MNATDISNLFSEYIPVETLKAYVNNVLEYLPEDIKNVVPVIQVGNDGLTLPSILLVTNSYICELRLNAKPVETDFDMVAKNTIFNYRIKTWTHEIKVEEVVKASFEIAEVDLAHGSSNGFRTKLSFAGSLSDREAWLKNLTQAIPINLVLGFSNK